MAPLVKSLLSYLRGMLALLFPSYCIQCGRLLQAGESQLCLHCLVTLPYSRMTLFGENRVRRLLLPTPLQGAFALLEYARGCDVQRIIHRLKYLPIDKCHFGMALGRYLGRMMAHELQRLAANDTAMAAYLDTMDALLPLPLSDERLRTRGYNQAEQLARGMAEVLGKPVWTGLMTRAATEHTQVQSSHLARKQNMTGDGNPFAVLRAESLRGRHVALVDDIITTGATFQAALRALLDAAPDARCSVFALAVTTPQYLPSTDRPLNFEV